MQLLQLQGPKVIPWDHPLDAAGRAQGAPDPRQGCRAGQERPSHSPGIAELQKPLRSPSPSCARPLLGTPSTECLRNTNLGIPAPEPPLAPSLLLFKKFPAAPSTPGCVGYAGMEEGHIPGIQHFTLILIPIPDTSQHRFITKFTPNSTG